MFAKAVVGLNVKCSDQSTKFCFAIKLFHASLNYSLDMIYGATILCKHPPPQKKEEEEESLLV